MRLFSKQQPAIGEIMLADRRPSTQITSHSFGRAAIWRPSKNLWIVGSEETVLQMMNDHIQCFNLEKSGTVHQYFSSVIYQYTRPKDAWRKCRELDYILKSEYRHGNV